MATTRPKDRRIPIYLIADRLANEVPLIIHNRDGTKTAAITSYDVENHVMEVVLINTHENDPEHHKSIHLADLGVLDCDMILDAVLACDH